MTANLVTFHLTGEGSGVAQSVREDGTHHVIQTDAPPPSAAMIRLPARWPMLWPR